MKKGRRKGSWWIIAVICVIAAAILGGYYFGKKKTPEQVNAPIIKQKAPPHDIEMGEKEGKAVKKEIVPEEDREGVEGEAETRQPVQQNPCELLEDQVREFFNYLNGREYIQNITGGLDSYGRFKRIMNELSSGPPIPGGEGLNKEVMIKNIFFFFRVLGRQDIRFIKEIFENESDTLELNLEIFYTWLMLGNSCPDQDNLRPSFDIIYHYAGFFTNTIGGKAYLLRRALRTRLLVSYYCLLILHEADKRGTNRYGIDVFPRIDPLIKEISMSPDLRYQDSYIEKLTHMQDYYLQKR